MNKYQFTFSDNGEKMIVEADNLVDLTPIIQGFNNQKRGCTIQRVVDSQVVEETKTTNKGENMNRVQEICPRCKGTGKYQDKQDSKCFKCEGNKVVFYNPMSKSQINLIRMLFKKARPAMSVDKQENLISIMEKHISGTELKSTLWASAAINKLKEITEKMGR